MLEFTGPRASYEEELQKLNSFKDIDEIMSVAQSNLCHENSELPNETHPCSKIEKIASQTMADSFLKKLPTK